MKIQKRQNRLVLHETPEKIKQEHHHFVSDRLRGEIEKKAYELFAGRGFVHGHDLDDWLEAEQLVLKRRVE